jgi:putative NADPH-quinone reductase
MKISIILAHPNPGSFNHAIAFRAGTGGLHSAEN